jgi:hypothetical protein
MAVSFDVTAEDISYYPSDVPIPTVNGGAFPANQGPYFNWYQGAGTAPAGGRIAFVRFNGGGYNSSTRQDTAIATDTPTDYRIWICGEMLARGANVFSVSVITGNTSNTYVAGGVTSKGLLHPPGVTPTGLAFTPFTSVNYPMAFKDAIHFIQFLKKNATTYGINPDRIVLYGDSYSADCALFAVCRDWKGYLGSVGTDSQYGFSTRVAAIIPDRGHSYFPAFEPTGITAPMFPTSADPSSNTAMTNLSDAPAGYPEKMSMLGPQGQADLDFFRSIPCYYSSGCSAGTSSDTIAVNTVITSPYTGLTASELSHSAWFGAAMKAAGWSASFRLAAGSASCAAALADEDFTYGTDAQTAAQKAAVLVPDYVSWLFRYPLASKMPAAVRG